MPLISIATAADNGNSCPSVSVRAVMQNLCGLISGSAFFQGFHNDLADVSAPLFKRNPALGEKLVALVDGRNS